METAIVVTDLTKTYGAIPAVRNLSLAVPAGSVFGFLGSNGAGKTTTIRMLLGLVRPTSGTAAVLGFDAHRERARVAPLVGAMVETPAFYPHLSGAENLQAFAFGAGHDLPESEAERLLALVGLSHRSKRPVKEYSLGMKQRLGIANALIGNPPVLFLDEPTNGLDPDGAREVRDLLGSLRRSGRTIFLSSHLLGEVERVFTDVAIVQQGTLRVQGSVAALLASGGFEVRLSSVKLASAALDLPLDEGASAGPGWISVAGGDAVVPGILRRLLQAGVDVFEVRAKRSSLEELFFGAMDSSAQGGSL